MDSRRRRSKKQLQLFSQFSFQFPVNWHCFRHFTLDDRKFRTSVKKATICLMFSSFGFISPLLRLLANSRNEIPILEFQMNAFTETTTNTTMTLMTNTYLYFLLFLFFILLTSVIWLPSDFHGNAHWRLQFVYVCVYLSRE